MQIWLSLSLAASFLPSLHISTPHKHPISNYSDQNEERDGQSKAQEGEERREKPKESKQASGKRSSLYPSTRRGEVFDALVAIQRKEEDANHAPFFCFDCHLIQFIAHLFLCGHFPVFFFFSYIGIPVTVYCPRAALLRIGHMK